MIREFLEDLAAITALAAFTAAILTWGGILKWLLT